MLAHGQLEPARAALQQLQTDHPDSARVRYLFGNLDYAQGDRERALDDYHEAIRLDPGYRSDAVLRANVRALLDRRVEGPDAVSLLVDDIGKPALAEIVDCAKTCQDDRIRRRAVQAAVKLGGPALIAAQGKAIGEVEDATLDKLRHGRSCRDRKAAALEIIATGNPEYLDSSSRPRAQGRLPRLASGQRLHAARPRRRHPQAGARKLTARAFQIMTTDAKPAPKSKRSPKAPKPPKPPGGGYFHRVISSPAWSSSSPAVRRLPDRRARDAGSTTAPTSHASELLSSSRQPRRTSRPTSASGSRSCSRSR